MDEIGSLLKTTRESSGVSIEEASKDVDIKPEILQNIEDGKIGCFKDIYVLKDYIKNYSKYLGLDSDKLNDQFNDYMFEYTSKIPVKEIEHLMKEKEKEEVKEKQDKIVSPYTMEVKEHKNKKFIIGLIILIFLVFLVVLWSLKQLTVNTISTNEISYIEE